MNKEDFINVSYRGNSNVDKNVLEFIFDFLNFNGDPEYTRILYRRRYCYYFAHMLKTAFNCGEVCWTAPYGHFVWVKDSIAYDIEGTYSGEANYFIPEFLMGDAVLDFKHIPGVDNNTSKEEIDKIISDYWEYLGWGFKI